MQFLQLVLHVLVVRVAAVQLQSKQGASVAAGRALESAVRQRQYAMWSANLRPNISLLETGITQNQNGASVGASEFRSLAGLKGRALGQAASMSESGYRAVARVKSRLAMRNYIERVLEKERLVITKAGDLEGLLPYYDGECARQSYSNLVAELRRGTVKHGCREPWLAHKDGGAALLQIDANYWKQVFHRRVPSLRAALLQTSKDLQGVPSTGAHAPLNEQGYQAVASTKNNKEMIAFIKRVMERDGLRVQNEYGLNGFVPYYSGECATQSFDALVTELHHSAPTLVAEAILSNAGRAAPASMAANGALKRKSKPQISAEQLHKLHHAAPTPVAEAILSNTGQAAPTSVVANGALRRKYKHQVSAEQLRKAIPNAANMDRSSETTSSADAAFDRRNTTKYSERLTAQDKDSSVNTMPADVNASKHNILGSTAELDKKRRMRKKLLLNQIVSRHSAESSRKVAKRFRADLEGLKLKALKDLAREEGVTERQIEDADDTDDPVESMMGIIVRGRKARAQQAHLETLTDVEKHKAPSGFVQGACGSGWVA